MGRTREERLLRPKAGSKIDEARDYGIDLSQVVENLRLTPAERIKKNDQALNSMLMFEAAMKRAKANK